jgi:hypothetical protein
MRAVPMVWLAAFAASASADEPMAPPSIEEQPPAIQQASRVGVALGAAQRCGLAAADAETMMKLGFAHLQMLAKDKDLYAQAAQVMVESQRYGATDMPQPAGGCQSILPIAAGILGNLTYIVARAEPDVPDLHRSSPLENFAAWAGQLAVMGSHCGAPNSIVNHGVDLARQYMSKAPGDARVHERADAELSAVMLQAELENWGDQAKCTEILTNFGSFFGNLDSRLQEAQ